VYSVIEMLAFCRKNFIVHGSITAESFRLRNSAFNTAKMAQRGSLPVDWIKSVNFTDSSYILDGGFLGTPRDKLTIPSGYCYSNQRPLPLYMAPEVFEHKYSYEADMWSLGVMSYELLTGRFPFWSSSQQALNVAPAGVRAAVRKRQPDLSSPPLRRLSTTCLDFLYQLLDKNPLSRMDFYKALQHPWVFRRVKKVMDPDWGPEYILNKKLT
jgi:serine/threonine protein kinase